MTRGVAIISLIIVSALSFYFLSMAGITEDHIFNPVGLSTKIISPASLGINLTFMALFIILFPLFYVVIGLYSLREKEPDHSIIIAPVLLSPLILFYLGISLSSILISLGFILSVFLAHNASFRDKEQYRKISLSGITKSGAGTALLVLNIFIVIAAYTMIPQDPQQIRDEFRSDLGSTLEDIMPVMIGVSTLDSQRNQIYVFVEYIEEALLSSMEAGMSGLTEQESSKCARALRNNMAKIDADTKARLDTQFDEKVGSISASDFIPEPLVEQVSPYYPLLIISTLFLSLEFLRLLFLVRLSGIYAWLISLFTGATSSHAQAKKSAPHAAPAEPRYPPLNAGGSQIPDPERNSGY